MKLKKIFLSTLALSLCFNLLVACSSKENPNLAINTSVKTTTKKVTTSKTQTSKKTSTSTTTKETEPAYSFQTTGTDDLTITKFVKNTSKTQLDELVVPDEIDGIPVTKIGFNAFSSGFSNMTIDKIVFGKNIKEISFINFNLDNIQSIEIDSDNEHFKIVNDCILSYDEKTFILALNSKSLTIPSTVETIGSYSLNTVSTEVMNGFEFPSNIKTINTNSLTNRVDTIILNEGLTTVNDTGLYVNNIIVPKSLTKLVARSFYEVENISVASGNPKYDSRDNCNCVIETETNELKMVGKNYKIPSSVTSISSSVFGYTSRFTSITIPSTVRQIDGDFTFGFCSNLVTLVLPSDIRFVNGISQVNHMRYAIEGCSNLKSFNIPDTVTCLYSTDLYNLNSLEYLYIPAITKIDKDVFKNTPKLTKVKINLTKSEWDALEYVDTSNRLKDIEFEFKS